MASYYLQLIKSPLEHKALMLQMLIAPATLEITQFPDKVLISLILQF